jgi:hypothetical protein
MKVNQLKNIAYDIQALMLRTHSRAAGNKGFVIAGVTCFADTFVQGGSSVLRMKFSAKTPRHAKKTRQKNENRYYV